MENKPCNFCNPERFDFPHLKKYGFDRIDRLPLFETDNLVIQPDILPSSPYFHALIIPRAHRFSFAQNHGLGDEVGRLMYTIEERTGLSVAFFEHGGVEEGSKIQSVYHNHAHLIETGGNRVIDFMSDVLTDNNVFFTRISGIGASPAQNVQDLNLGDTGYLYIQHGPEALVAADHNDNFPSQIAQRNMSRLHGRELDWKQIPNDDSLARESVVRILNTIHSCQQ